MQGTVTGTDATPLPQWTEQPGETPDGGPGPQGARPCVMRVGVRWSSMRGRFWLVFVGALVACGDDRSTTIEVSPGPRIQVNEGEEVRSTLRVDGGDAEFRIEASDEVDLLLDYTVEASPDGPTLVVTPHCSAIAAGSVLTRIAELVVVADGVDAMPVPVEIEIVPNEVGACAPRVAAWVGDCADAMPAPATEVSVPLLATPQTLCVEVTLPDSVTEPLPVTLTLTPEIAGTSNDLGTYTLAGGAPLGETYRWVHAVALPNAADDYRGRAELAVEWNLGTPQRAEVGFIFGAPGDGVIRSLRLQGASELSTNRGKFQVAYYARPAETACVRVTASAESATGVVLRGPSGEVVLAGEMLCGETTYSLEALPWVDSKLAEVVTIELLRCDIATCMGDESQCCSAPSATVSSVATRDVTVWTESVVEEIPLVPATSGPDARACADIDGDGNPEVVAIDDIGTRVVVSTLETAPAMLPTGVRFTKTQPLGDATAVLAFRWHDSSSDPPERPVVLGSLTDGTMRRATLTAWGATFVPRAVSITESQLWAPLAPSLQEGASYIAFKAAASTIRIACISSPACSDDIPDLDVQGANSRVVRALAPADFDGDGDLDLVVVLQAMPLAVNSRPVTVFAIDLAWTGHAITSVGAPVQLAVAQTPLAWTQVRILGLPPVSGSPATFYVHVSESPAESLLIEIPGCDSLPCPANTLETYGTVRSIAEVNGALLVATDTQVWELGVPGWSPMDPVRRATAGASLPIPGATDAYGANLGACVATGDPSFVFDTEAGTRWTRHGVPVDQLPAATP